jgi:hypothetical protein
MAQAEEDGEPALFLAHTSPVLQPRGEESKGEARASLHNHSTSPHEPRVRAFLGDGSDDDKLEGWYLDSSAMHHMTGRVEHFADLDRSI